MNTHHASDRKSFSTHRLNRNRRGNLLVGCLTALGIFLIVVIIATVFVIRMWRGWAAGWMESGLETALIEMKIDDAEQGEIMGHVNTLMTRFKDKEIGFEELALVVESIAESPLVGAAIVGGVDAMYFKESGLSEEEKTEGRVQLARYAQGLREKSIDPDTLESVLDSVSTATPDGDDIQINVPEKLNITLRSADEVSDDDLREVIAQARGQRRTRPQSTRSPKRSISPTHSASRSQTRSTRTRANGSRGTNCPHRLWTPNRLRTMKSNPRQMTSRNSSR